jgi:hypothetical protein
MNWTASTTDNWITITSGSSGTDAGTINVSYTANSGVARIAIISIIYSGGIASPTNVEIRQADGTQPELSVSPDHRDVTKDAGMTSYDVNNTGTGTMNWTATTIDNWITITNGSSGTDAGTINVSYTANSGVARTGTITVTAAGATGSPKTVEVRQADGRVPVYKSHEIVNNMENIFSDNQNAMIQDLFDILTNTINNEINVCLDVSIILDIENYDIVQNLDLYYQNVSFGLEEKLQSTLTNDKFTVEMVVRYNSILSVGEFFNLIKAISIDNFSVVESMIEKIIPELQILKLEYTLVDQTIVIEEINLDLENYRTFIIDKVREILNQDTVVKRFNQFIVHSPVDLELLQITDGDTLITGYHQGNEKYEIPFSVYTGDAEPEIISVIGKSDYELKLHGTDDGTFDLEINTYDSINDSMNITFIQMPIDTSTQCFFSLDTSNLGNIDPNDLILSYDTDGDGQIDTSYTPTDLTITGLDWNKANLLPATFSLKQNYPNPFNPSTIIDYSIQESGYVKLFVYNTVGERVATLVDEYKPSGYYSVVFNSTNLSSGIYFYRIQTKKFIESKKMMLLK